MARVKGSKNKRTLLREAELEAIRAGSKKDVLTSIYVMEHIMEYFFFQAKGMRAVGNWCAPRLTGQVAGCAKH